MDSDAKISSSVQEYLASLSQRTAEVENLTATIERSLQTLIRSCRPSGNCTCTINDDKPENEDGTTLAPPTERQGPLVPTKDEEALVTAATQQEIRGHSALTLVGLAYVIAAALVVLVLDAIIIFHYRGKIFDNITAWLLWSLTTYPVIAIVTATMITLPVNAHVKGLFLFVAVIGMALGCGFATFPPWINPKP